jgi:caffeoyl-CoA O-methyltransferase
LLTLVPEAIEIYAERHTSDPGPVLRGLAAATRSRSGIPSMMSGRTVGALLQTLVFVGGARRVLEIGTFTGYSALSMASALRDDGELITCDVDPEMTAIAREFWAKSPHGRKIKLVLGPALSTLVTLSGPFDLIFIDADKPNYPKYYQRALELLSPRGVIAIDNALWSGNVLDPQDEDARAIHELNEVIRHDRRVKHVLLTVRDGVMLVRQR